MSGTTSLLKIEPGLGDRRFSAVVRTAPQSKHRLLHPEASTLVSIRRCPVCFRAACPLKSHRQYARSRGLDDKKTAINARGSSSGINRSSTEEHLESPEGIQYRLSEISFAKVDCFVNFPLPKGVKAEVHQLFQDFFTLHQTKSTTGPKAGPSPLTPLMREILAACFNSPALCQSIVACSAVWHGSYRGHLVPDARILSLHGQAIQTFREGLSNPATAYSNSHILAAASLTHQQVLCRSHSGLKAHVDGIQTLVNARGGLHNVGWVAYIVLWIDYYTCLYVNQEPRFTWPTDNATRLSTNRDQIYGSAFESLQLGTLLDPDLRQLCIEVCRTVELLESTPGKGCSKSVQEYYRYKRTTMCIQLGHLHARFHGQGTINECVSLTLNIIVLKVFFMHVLEESRIDLCYKLRIALELTDIKFLQNGHIDLLSWVLFVAGALAPNMSPWKGWFTNRLKAVLSTYINRLPDQSFLEMYLKGHVGKMLRNHVWSEKLLAHAFETTLGLLMPIKKVPIISEKKMASFSGLFPG